jgi:light-regulated signal transduction histidine kinase (bacteriophytochrome)
VTRSELHTERVDLAEIARDIAAKLKTSEPDRMVELVIAGSIRAEGDRRLLKIALENLLGNAWKFTRKSAGARIEFRASDVGGERVYSVSDNGAGFDMAYAAKLFGVFQRLHSTAEFEGTGIGLATVQRIVEKHGGRIWAEGIVDRGATFSFVLPGAPE